MSDEQLTRKQKLKLAGLFVLVLLLGVLLGLLLCSSGGTEDLTVNVVSENGTQLPQAEVSLEDGEFLPTNDTGTDGPAANARVFEVENGTYTVTADAPQYDQNSTTVTVDGETNVTIELSTSDDVVPSKPAE